MSSRALSPPVVVVVGSTGCGKTELATTVARALGHCQVLNADAMQMYRGFDVATNKASLAERGGVPHHMLGNLPPDTLHFRVG